MAALKMQPVKTSQLIGELADREAIRDCLMRYSRAIDRRDAALLETVYWPEAHDHHGGIDGTAAEFIEAVIPAVSMMEQTMHSISNILIRLQDSHAAVESYFIAYHRMRDGGEQPADVLLGGRYTDQMEKRDDEWRILERTVMFDWYVSSPGQDWVSGAFGMTFTTNVFPSDFSYQLFRETGQG